MLWDADLVNGMERLRIPVHASVARLYAWACERIYHEAAGAYDMVAWIVSAGRWRHWQRLIWQDVAGPRVLELGCGTGHLLRDGAARGLTMTGLDLSPEMIALARRQCAGRAVCVRGDATTLPFASRSFDAVMATFPAPYVLEPAMLRECRRVLSPAPGGGLVILGLWVHVDLGGLERVAPVFYGQPSQDRLDRILARVEQARFTASTRVWQDGRATIGGVVAEAR
jgi:SAM-dependent methyltransferase